MVKQYIPKQGDIIFLNFDPQSGKEQSGRRPAIVVSPQIYNKKVGLGLFCPITSQSKDYPFEVPLEGKISGVILCDHIKNLDWIQREAHFVCKVSNKTLEEVLAKVQILIERE